MFDKTPRSKRFSVVERFYVNTMFREQFKERKWRKLEKNLSS